MSKTTKINVVGLDGKSAGTTNLPVQFSEPVREDLVKKAVMSLQSKARQTYGAKPEAGRRHAVDISRRRRDYKGSYGKGISRVPRKVLSRSGGQFNWVGAFAPGTIGGRRAHPPKAEKIWERKINTKENRKAIRSALSAVVNTELVSARGHFPPANYPFVVADGIENISKTKDLFTALQTLGFGKELERAVVPQKRSGRSVIRGRAKKTRKSILIVSATKNAPVSLAAKNIPGVEAVTVSELNAETLAPGTHVGRITVFTSSAIKEMEEKKLFI